MRVARCGKDYFWDQRRTLTPNNIWLKIRLWFSPTYTWIDMDAEKTDYLICYKVMDGITYIVDEMHLEEWCHKKNKP